MGTISRKEKNLNSGTVTQMCGCMAEDTEILMADGSQRSISNVRIGDRIMQPETHRPILVQNTWKGWEKQLILIQTVKGNAVMLTKEHPVYQGNGFIRADELKEGDTVYGEEGQKITVVSIAEVSYDGYVYNMDLQEDGGSSILLANGIVVGDMQVQNRM